eukprot:246432-Rhodomonas_salina.1
MWHAGARAQPQRVWSVLADYLSASTEADWLDETDISHAGVGQFQYNTEGCKYLHWAHVLAATDGSVKRKHNLMGAGFVFLDDSDNNDEHVWSHNCAVGGDLSSLRAEAAALDLLLDCTDQQWKLVVFLDSLALMQTLKGWDR